MKENAAQEGEKLVRDYAKRDKTIMLVVWPAGEDLANSEALKLAHEYDPEGD